MDINPIHGKSEVARNQASDAAVSDVIKRYIAATKGANLLQQGISQVNRVSAVDSTKGKSLLELQMEFAKLFGATSLSDFSLNDILALSNSTDFIQKFGSQLGDLIQKAQQLNALGDSKPLEIVNALMQNWQAPATAGGWSTEQRTMILQMIYKAQNPNGSLADFGQWCSDQVAGKTIYAGLAAGVIDDAGWHPASKTWDDTSYLIQGDTLTPGQIASLQKNPPQLIVITAGTDFAGVFSSLANWFNEVAGKTKDSTSVMQAFSMLGFALHQAYDNAVGRGISDPVMQQTIDQVNKLWSSLFAAESLATETAKVVAQALSQIAEQYGGDKLKAALVQSLLDQNKSDSMAGNIANMFASGNFNLDTRVDQLFIQALFGGLSPEEARKLQEVRNIIGAAELKAQRGDHHEEGPIDKVTRPKRGQE